MYLMILVRVIHSWVPISLGGGAGKVLDFVYDVTDPIFSFFRRYIPIVELGGIGLDLTPFIALVCLEILHNFLVRLLLSL